ncbi:predicted protein [Postia placenta Mad-698-R]|nr:predicted protein [Postia placenta Mad-698-R]
MRLVASSLGLSWNFKQLKPRGPRMRTDASIAIARGYRSGIAALALQYCRRTAIVFPSVRGGYCGLVTGIGNCVLYLMYPLPQYYEGDTLSRLEVKRQRMNKPESPGAFDWVLTKAINERCSSSRLGTKVETEVPRAAELVRAQHADAAPGAAWSVLQLLHTMVLLITDSLQVL